MWFYLILICVCLCSITRVFKANFYKTMSKRQLDIKVSPGTFQKLTSDEEFRDSLAQEAGALGEFDQIIFTPNDPDEAMEPFLDLQSSSCSSDAARKKTMWLEATTKFLISRVKELWPKVGKSVSLKNKKQMWKKIADELCEQGHNFTWVQVEAKFFTLERQYKKTKLHNSKTGRNRQTCPFQSELDEVLENRKAINPEFLLSSETEVTDTTTTQNDVTASPESELPSTSKRRRTAIEDFMEKAEERAQRREEREIILQQKIQEGLKRKEERAEKKEALETQKVEMLKKLISILDKEE